MSDTTHTAGIHIHCRPVIPDDYNLTQTIEKTSKVVLLVSSQPQNLLKNYYMILLCTFYLCFDYFSST